MTRRKSILAALRALPGVIVIPMPKPRRMEADDEARAAFYRAIYSAPVGTERPATAEKTK